MCKMPSTSARSVFQHPQPSQGTRGRTDLFLDWLDLARALLTANRASGQGSGLLLRGLEDERQHGPGQELVALGVRLQVFVQRHQPLRALRTRTRAAPHTTAKAAQAQFIQRGLRFDNDRIHAALNQRRSLLLQGKLCFRW